MQQPMLPCCRGLQLNLITYLCILNTHFFHTLLWSIMICPPLFNSILVPLPPLLSMLSFSNVWFIPTTLLLFKLHCISITLPLLTCILFTTSCMVFHWVLCLLLQNPLLSKIILQLTTFCLWSEIMLWMNLHLVACLVFFL